MIGQLDHTIAVHPDVQRYEVVEREPGSLDAYWMARIEVGHGEKPSLILRGYGYTRGAALRSAYDQLCEVARRKL